MKKYIKEFILWVLQLFMFYIFPLFAGPTDMMGMVVIIMLATFLFSILMGCISKVKIKYLYPLAIAIAFIPSCILHYNSSALIHSVWYLVLSAIGLFMGSLIKVILKAFKTHHQ